MILPDSLCCTYVVMTLSLKSSFQMQLVTQNTVLLSIELKIHQCWMKCFDRTTIQCTIRFCWSSMVRFELAGILTWFVLRFICLYVIDYLLKLMTALNCIDTIFPERQQEMDSLPKYWRWKETLMTLCFRNQKFLPFAVGFSVKVCMFLLSIPCFLCLTKDIQILDLFLTHKPTSLLDIWETNRHQ